MSLRRRIFLYSFVPFAVLLGLSFFLTQLLVQSTVRKSLRSSLRENHLAMTRARQKSDLQNSRFISIAGQNPALMAGMQLLLFQPDSLAARDTVEDQLRELCEHMGFDLLQVSAPDGARLAGVVRRNGELASLSTVQAEPDQTEIRIVDGRIFQTASVFIDQAGENLGSLTVGHYFDFSEFTTPAVLIHNGRVLKSSVPAASTAEVEKAMTACGADSECDLRLGDTDYLSLPVRGAVQSAGYTLRSLQNVDLSVSPVLAVLRGVFLIAAVIAVLLALLCSVLSARTIVRPIAVMISYLRRTERTGELPEFRGKLSEIREIRDLADSFNRAAVSIRDGRRGLQTAYLEFVESLANALDARDNCTAGHSWRVSQLACATAGALGLRPIDVERIRVGALLHDIGKIGIADRVLQKPGPLSADEMDVVKSHPAIGRHILEGVHGFAPYLAAVEFHHENWDGTGYPHGQKGEETPIDARIIHVADSYDAMTSDRPYRTGMTHERAVGILLTFAGSQFDPKVVEALVGHTSQNQAAGKGPTDTRPLTDFTPDPEFAPSGAL